MRISDWSSDVCSSDLLRVIPEGRTVPAEALDRIAGSYMCSRAKACVAVWLDDKRIGVLGQNEPGESLNFDFVTQNRSEESRVGKEGVSTCKSRVSPLR